jgi:DNA primase
MHRGTRQKHSNIYTEEQIKRIIVGSGIDIESEVDSDFIIMCPWHNNYRTPAGEICKKYGNFYCFGCNHSANLTEFVMHVTKKTYFEASRFIHSMETESDILDIVNKTLHKEPEFLPFDELMIRRLNAQALDSPRAMRYYEGRRIGKSSVEKFLLGYSEKQDMVTIPVTNPDGSIFIGFVARSVEGKEFKNTPKLPKSKTLFNISRARKFDTVYVVESSFDVIRLDQNGIAAVATLGATVSSTQCELLKKYFNNVVVIGDNDDAGRGMQAKVLEKLGSRATLISIPDRFKDIGDMTDEDIQKLTNKIQDPLLSFIQ